MQTAVTPTYTFNSTTRQIDFSGFTGFNISLLYGIIDLKTSSFIYQAGDPRRGYSNLNGSVLTLLCDVTNLSNTDPLMIIYDSNGGGTTVTSSPSAVTITQTTVTLAANTSSLLIGSNSSRKLLNWMVTGSNPMTVVPGVGPAVAGSGMNYNGNSGTGTQGGSESFAAGVAPTGQFQAISTLGTTVTVWEGQ